MQSLLECSRKLIKALCLVTFASVVSASAGPPPLPEIAYKNQLLDAPSSESYWEIYEAWITKSILTNVYGEPDRIYGEYKVNRMGRDSTFRRDMVGIFGFSSDGVDRVPPARAILGRYNARIDRLLQSGTVTEAEILRPAIVLRTLDGELIIRAIGEPVPKGAAPQAVLENEDYFRILATGHFPIGDYSLTTTNAPTFIHDLAHLDGFLEDPRYMTLIRKYAGMVHAGNVPSMPNRAYFFNEGLTILNPRSFQIVNRTLALSEQMRHNSGSVSLYEMTSYLRSLSEDQLTLLANKLNSIVKHPRIFQVLGGAGREMFSSNGHAFHNPFSELAENMYESPEKTASVIGIAKVQLALLKMQQISSNDWFTTLLNKDIPANSPVKDLIDSGVFESPSENRTIDKFVQAFGGWPTKLKTCETLF